MLITGKGMIIRLNTADISTIGRNTQGVRLIQLEEGDQLGVGGPAGRAGRERGAGEPRSEPEGRRGMRERRHVARGGALALALALVGCGHPEQKVVDQYFNAVNRRTTRPSQLRRGQVRQEGRQAGRSPQVTPKTKAPGGAARAREEGQRADGRSPTTRRPTTPTSSTTRRRSTRSASCCKKDAQDSRPTSKRYAAEWEKFNEKDRDLKKALADAKDAVEKEKRNVALSVGQLDDIETLTGELVTKTLDLDLTIDGEDTSPTRWTLRKYEMQASRRPGGWCSRWVSSALEPRRRARPATPARGRRSGRRGAWRRSRRRTRSA